MTPERPHDSGAGAAEAAPAATAPTAPSASATGDWSDVSELMEVYGKRLDNEHAHIASRTGWLLTLDAFLVATLGIAVANTDKITEELAFGLVVIVAAVGALSNASCLFSNYWAGRAIDEASERVSTELAARFSRAGQRGSRPATGAASATEAGTEAETQADAQADVEWWIGRLRLYGRDPRAEPERVGFWLPPSGVLHPWFLIPSIFVVTFVASPMAFAAYFGSGGSAWALATAPAVLLALTFGTGLRADHVYNARKEGLSTKEYRALRRLKATNASKAARARREAKGRENRALLQAAPSE